RDTDLRTSLEPSGAEDIGIYTPFHDGARVYLTVPGGRREGFTFRAAPAGGFAGGFGFFNPTFVPDAGVTSSLSLPGSYTLVRGQLGEYYGLVGGGTLAFNPADNLNFGGQYVLATKEGLAYTVDAVSGDLLSVTDSHANTLSFTNIAVTSSAGPRVTFERDPQGRITAAVDPTGKKVRYQYDAKGDLTS